MIKIAHIARPVSGVGVYIDLLTKNIDNEKFSNIIVCNTNEKIIHPKDKSGVEIQKFHANIKRKIHFFNDLVTLISILKILKRERPDIIHCHSAKSGILGRLAGFLLKIKTFYTPHAYSYLSHESPKIKRIYRFIEKTISLLPSITLACSNSEYDRAINDLKIKPNKVCVWQNSIEEKLKLACSENVKKLPKEFVCTIGRPSYQKNTELLIEIIAEVKKEINNIHLVILGVGLYSPSLGEIKAMIKNLDLEENITLVSWLYRPETLEALKQSRFYITASRYEGLPYSLIEAIALGKPSIVSNVDGNKDIIVDGYNGYLVEEKTEFVTRISNLYKDDDLLKTMSENSKRHFTKNFRIDKNIAALENIYCLNLANKY